MKHLATFLIVCSLFACHSNAELEQQYPDQLGEIEHDWQTDRWNFQLCTPDSLVQSRLAISYEGGNEEIERVCQEKLMTIGDTSSYTGYIVARFLINCEKETGRFRFQTLDEAFLEQACPSSLVKAVQEAVEDLDQWVFTRPQHQHKDHSKYLNFKFQNGQLQSIIH